MSDGSPLDTALTRLSRAVDGLEAAVNRRAEADETINALQEEVQSLGDDRSELAQSLDKARGRASRLEEVNQEVSRRLVKAMETIRTILEAPR